jgi:hypothetical protein
MKGGPMGDRGNSEKPPPQVLTGGGIARTSAVGGGQLAMRSYLSFYHIQTAAFFARQSAVMEKEHGGKSWGEVWNSGAFAEHRAYVTGAVFAAAAFLETTINELFKDAVEEHSGGPVTQLPESVRSLIAERWRQGVDRFDSLSKYQTALILARQDPFPTGVQPYQDLRLLTNFRNRLIHFEPETITAGEPEEQATFHKVEQQLAGKFPPNPLIPEDSRNPVYPDKCLSHGCAKWAVESALRFADDFCSRMKITPRHDPYRSLLKTD